MWDELKDRPLLVLLGTIGLALCIWALSFVVRAVFAGVGLAVAIVAGGVVGAAAISPWIVPAASVGVTATGAFFTYKVAITVVQQAKSKPFEFATATLSFVSAIAIGMVKEYELKDMPATALLLAAATAFAVAVGGALLKSGGWWRALIGFVFPLLPAGVVLGYSLSHDARPFMESVRELTPASLVALALLLLSSVFLAILANRSSDAQ